MVRASNKQRLKHIVVLMLENRSFDQMLGTVPGVDGVLDESGNVRSQLFNLENPVDPTSPRYPVTLGAPFSVSRNGGSGPLEVLGGPSHSFPAVTEQLFGAQDISEAIPETTPELNAGFVKSWMDNLAGTDVGMNATVDDIGQVMAVFTQDQLPVINKLAREFCVCDRWFSEVPGPTEPNRLFVHAATSTGLTYNPWRYDVLDTPTVFDRLTDEGVAWKLYFQDLSDASNFKGLRDSPNHVHVDHFYADAKSGALPGYSFLCPRYTDVESEKANSQHAPADVRCGEEFIADVYEALRSGPAWEQTLLVITHDEHGGYYDHVFPPQDAPNPDGLNSPNAFMKKEAAHYGGKRYLLNPTYAFDFQRFGCRVPAVLVSPWIAAGTVNSKRLQHTSIIATLRELYGFDALTWRDADAASLSGVVGKLERPRTDCPRKLERPRIPDDSTAAGGEAPPTEKQVEVANRYSANLEGHSDQRARRPKDFCDKAELAAYVLERRRAHEKTVSERRRKARFETFRDDGGGYGWRLLNSSGAPVAHSPRSYDRAEEARDAIAQTRDLAAAAPLGFEAVTRPRGRIPR